MNFHRNHTYVEYATVKGLMVNKTDKAVLIAVDGKPAKWIPLFRLETPSRALVYRTDKDTEVSLRVQLQFALNEGLV